MFSNRRIVSYRSIRRTSAGALMAAAGVLALPLQAADVEHETLEIHNQPTAPWVQAEIVACIGESVLFTGTVDITIKDGEYTHYNWGNMTGETPDGDVFMGGSTVNIGQQSTVTLTEIGAGKNRRQFKLHMVNGEVSVTCN